MPWRSVAVEDGQPEQAPFIVEIDDPVAEALEDDVATVAGDRRADPRLDQLLDRLDRLGIVGVEEFLFRRRGAPERTGAPERKNSVTTPSTAGLSWLHSPALLVTEMKSGVKNTPPTPGSSISALASGEASASAASRASNVPDSSTGRPGRNLSVAGLGVASVWMNTAGS